MNRIELLEKLKNEFPNYTEFIKTMIEELSDTDKPRAHPNYIFQSLSRDEKRIFIIVASIIPCFDQKRSIILTSNEEELEALANLFEELFPALQVKVVNQRLIKMQWDSIHKKRRDDNFAPDKFTNHDILLCAPHVFLLLKNDFKGVLNDVRAVCFHMVAPSEWYYSETLALTQKLSNSSSECHLFYSSTSDLPHIHALCGVKWIGTYTLPALRKDVSWYNLINPITDFNLHDAYLRTSIKHLLDQERAGGALLIIADKRNHSKFNHVFYDYEAGEELFEKTEAIAFGEAPAEIDEADILLIQDFFLDPSWVPMHLETVVADILNALQYLKEGGKVVFFTPWQAQATDASLSGLFPVRIEPVQMDTMMLFLLNHDRPLKKELKALFDSISDKALFQFTPDLFSSRLALLTREMLVGESHGRYYLTRREKRTHKPDGHTIVRYRSFLEHRIQLYLDKRFSDEINSPQALKRFTVKARDLTKRFHFYPHIQHLEELLDWVIDEDFAEDFDEDDADSTSDEYDYAMSNFSRINPKYAEFDPFKETEGDTAADLASAKQRAHYYRKKPAGQRFVKNRQYDVLFSHLIQHRADFCYETHQPIQWEDLIRGIKIRMGDREVKLSRSKGYRLVLEKVQAKELKEVISEAGGRKSKQRILKPNYLNERENQIGFRGRPPKYLVPYEFDLNALDQDRCGDCHLFTSTCQCDLINALLKLGKPETIPHLEVRKLLLHKTVMPHLRIHPHMRACDRYQKRMRDFELKSLPITTQYDVDRITGGQIETEVYRCHIKGCEGTMPYNPDQRTYKCPTCHTKYTKIVKYDKTEAIRGNVDVHYTKNAVLRKLCGIQEQDTEEQDSENKKKIKTRQYKKALKKSKLKTSANQARTQVVDYDPDLRKNLQQKYATVGFYQPRIVSILLSYTLATLELKKLQKIEDSIIDHHVYIQLNQIRRYAEATSISQLRTAERVIAKQYWEVCYRIFDRLGLPLSNRKLLRYVKEFLEQPFRGSKGYTPGNCLINNIHKICYETFRKLVAKYGFGFECPGFAEHTNPKFGFVLDLSDLLKGAYRFALIQAIIEGTITTDDLYSIFGRHNQEIFLLKTEAYHKLEHLVKSINQKILYSLTESTGGSYYDEKPLGDAIDQFIRQLADDLKFRDHLEAYFIYAPDADDYGYVASILEDYNVPLPITS